MIELKILLTNSSDLSPCRMMFEMIIPDCSRRIKSKMKIHIILKIEISEKVAIAKTVWTAATGASNGLKRRGSTTTGWLSILAPHS